MVMKKKLNTHCIVMLVLMSVAYQSSFGYPWGDKIFSKHELDRYVRW